MPLTLFQPAPTLTPRDLPHVEVRALYVHIPFCFHKCHYCDFYSITRQSEDRMAAFVARVLREADLWREAPNGPLIRPRTVFFGGGTPSLLPIEQMRRLIIGLRERFDVSRLLEWTVECNPATVSTEYAGMLRSVGVDRLSFGAQSFDREDLAVLERHHDPDDVPRSVEVAGAAGFSRLNLDMIYAVPGQSLERWLQNLEKALALWTTHLSCYALTFEPNTPLTVKQRLGKLTAAADDLELQMLHATRHRLASAGLHAYEISNYAAVGQACQHNLAYWHGDDYIALGPSGASHVQGHRWKNRAHLGEWERAVDARTLPIDQYERLAPRRRASELAMFRLRLREGIVFTDFTQRTGLDARAEFSDPIDRFTRAGLLEADSDGVRLTPRGLDVTDALAAEFLLEDRDQRGLSLG